MPQIRRGNRDNLGIFLKTDFVTPLLNHLVETALVRVTTYVFVEIRKINFELSSVSPLIYSTVFIHMILAFRGSYSALQCIYSGLVALAVK